MPAVFYKLSTLSSGEVSMIFRVAFSDSEAAMRLATATDPRVEIVWRRV